MLILESDWRLYQEFYLGIWLRLAEMLSTYCDSTKYGIMNKLWKYHWYVGYSSYLAEMTAKMELLIKIPPNFL